MNAETEIALGEEILIAEKNRCATPIAAVAESLGATKTAGCGVPAVQQSVCAVLLGADAGAQQLCSDVCARCRQVPSGANIAVINRMAIAARWKTPCNMISLYHGIKFSL